MGKSGSLVKSLNELASLAEEQGWVVSRTNGGHLKWTPPEGEFIITSSTPAQQRTLRNIMSDLRAAGLETNRAVWKRTRRDSNIIELVQSGSKEMLKQIVRDAMADTSSILRELRDDVDEWSDNELINAARLIDPATRKIILTCGCGKSYPHLNGAVIHMSKCDQSPMAPLPGEIRPELEEPVKRNMTTPPERERLNCPDCPEWFWISQPQALANHLNEEHGKVECPYCHGTFMVARGGLTKHVKACSMNPENVKIVQQREATITPIRAASPEHPASTPVRPVPAPRVMTPPPVTSKATPGASRPPAPVRDDGAAAAGSAVASPPAPPTPVPPPAPPAPKPAATSAATDDDLFVLLEMVLDGPVRISAKSLAAINAWMEATRALIQIKEEG